MLQTEWQFHYIPLNLLMVAIEIMSGAMLEEVANFWCVIEHLGNVYQIHWTTFIQFDIFCFFFFVFALKAAAKTFSPFFVALVMLRF